MRVVKTTVGICFYCKKPILGKEKNCPHCNAARRVIKVNVRRTQTSPSWRFWNKTYSYEVLDAKYKYVEKYLNSPEEV